MSHTDVGRKSSSAGFFYRYMVPEMMGSLFMVSVDGSFSVHPKDKTNLIDIFNKTK